jgi:hypothetical protein
VIAGLAVLLLCYIEGAVSYPSGAPTSACNSGTPGSPHGGQSSDPFPYQITSSAIPNGYVPGQTYTVTISKKESSDVDFRGFLCQVRQVGQETPIGTFQPVDAAKSKTIDCSGQQSSITHINRVQVAEQSFLWTSNVVLGQGTQVHVVCTVVQTIATLWILEESASFNELEPTGTLPPAPTIATLNPAILPQIDFSGCGDTKACYRNPSDCNSASGCDYGLTATYNASTSTISFMLVSNSGGYVALGFSRDTSMGEDDVVSCQRNAIGPLATVKDGWNPNGHNPNENDPNNIFSGINTTGYFFDGGIVCFFERPVNSTDSKDYDLSEALYGFFATSPDRGDSLTQHRKVPAISDKRVDFRVPQIITVEDKPLIKAHGIIMVLAWITLASTGMLLARYFKVVFLGTKWFNAHRTHMIIAVILSIVAFIIIFVEAEEWVYNSHNDWKYNAHPIIGLICIIFALANPIGALFRCHPGTPNRWIFNWAHFLGGVTALITGIVAVFLGIEIARDVFFSNLDDNATSILIAWVVIQSVFWIILEVLAIMAAKKKKQSASNEIEMKSKDAVDSNEPPKSEPPKSEPSEV